MSAGILTAWQKTLRRCGAACAVVQAADGATVTFAGLERRAALWCARWASPPGTWAGRAVVFAVPNGIGWLEIFLGLMHAGAIAVPLDAGEPVAEQCRLAATLRAGGWWDGEKLVRLPAAKRWRDPAVTLIKLTSGTTGRPRALVFTGAQLLADTRQIASTMGLGPRDVNYGMIPLGHSYGLGNLTLPLLAHGVPLVCGAAPLPHAIAADFARWRPTVFPGVPALWRALAATAGTADALASLRLGLSAGAPLPPEVARDFAARFGRRLHNFYGSSETGGIAYDATGGATLAGGVGRALRGVSLTALTGQRLRVTSAAVTTWRNPRRQGRRGSWVMPDRVTLDGRGQLTLIGRRGKTVKIAGRRVNLAEIVARLRRLPGVTDAWVGASAGSEPVLGAVVAAERTAVELRAALQADTAAWRIPKRWRVVAALPVSARGKVDAGALRTLLFGQGV